jgi:hypothetical protein
MFFSPSFVSAATVTVTNYELVVLKDTIGEFRLSFNPTTGNSWWIESNTGDVEVVDIVQVAGTASCPAGSVGCGQEFTVYHLRSSGVGIYTMEFRLGHSWNKDEYYNVAFLKLYIVDRTNLVLTDVLHKDPSGVFYFPSPCSGEKFCAAVIVPLNFEYGGLIDWANDHVNQTISVRVTDPYTIVLEASAIISTTVTSLTTVNTTITTGYGFQPQNFSGLTKLINDALAWLWCVILRRC